MYGFTANVRSAAAELRDCAVTGCVGSRWERRTHVLMREIIAIATVHPDVMKAASTALLDLSQALREDAPLDAGTITTVSRALDGLHREGGFELRSWVDDLREELGYARGRTLVQFLAPPLMASSRTTQANLREAVTA